MKTIDFKKQNKETLENISSGQAKDTGMALALICQLTGYFYQLQHVMIAGIIILVVNMVKPDIFLPVAKLWFGLSHLISMVMSKLILIFIYFAVITPMGILMKIVGIDPMQLKKWKGGHSSVFKMRNHKFRVEDIKKPF